MKVIELYKDYIIPEKRIMDYRDLLNSEDFVNNFDKIIQEKNIEN